MDTVEYDFFWKPKLDGLIGTGYGYNGIGFFL